MLINKTKQSGQTVIMVVFLSIAISLVVIGGLALPTAKAFQDARRLENSKQSYFTAESGVEDVAYRLKNLLSVDDEEVIELDGTFATTTIETGSDSKTVLATGDSANAIRKIGASFTVGSGASFNFGVQADQGGFNMANTSVIVGNLYSNGSVVGANTSRIEGDVVSAGSNGLISGVEAFGSAYAKTIQTSDIGGDAYYQTLTNTTVDGTKHPGSSVLATTSLPITDLMIEEWKTAALAGGVISSPCPYQITEATSIGPVKIACDLEISGNNYVVEIDGPIWVEGNITMTNSPTIRLDSSLEDSSVAIVADKPSNRLTSSKIDLRNTTTFEGTSEEGSYVMLISQNNSAQNGGSEDAIKLNQSVYGDILLYAGHGKIDIVNSGDLKQLTAYQISMGQSARVTYTTGIASIVFSSGPGGTWNINSWGEN